LRRFYPFGGLRAPDCQFDAGKTANPFLRAEPLSPPRALGAIKKIFR
jgi:hypothetical protein